VDHRQAGDDPGEDCRDRRHGGQQAGLVVLPLLQNVEGWSSLPVTQAPRFSALKDASRLEAAAEFPGLVIDLEEIWAGSSHGD